MFFISTEIVQNEEPSNNITNNMFKYFIDHLWGMVSFKLINYLLIIHTKKQFSRKILT